MDLRTVSQRWRLVLVAAVLALGVAGLMTIRTQPGYIATVRLFATTLSQGVSDALQGDLSAHRRVKSSADLLTNDRLAQRVVETDPPGLTAQQVRSRVPTQLQANLVLLTAMVTDSDQPIPQRLAETIATRFIALDVYAKVLFKSTGPGSARDPGYAPRKGGSESLGSLRAGDL
jgi:capsular polysaccharide biosynthesis protein